jgi:uncharacterized protein (TIGR02594 family)
MKKIILILALAIAPFAFASAADAKPKKNIHHSHHVYKHKKKIKRDAVKPVAEESINYAALRTHDDGSAAGYWANEAALQEAMKKQNQPAKVEVTRDDKRRVISEGCSWFSCSGQAGAVVARATSWIGKQAKQNKQELKNLFAVEFGHMPIDPARIPWCAAFANAILRRENQPTTHSLMARSFLNWGKVTHNPKEGDVVVLARGHSKYAGHVGFFMGYEWFDGVKYVKVLGGNTDHAVQVGHFPVSKVVGYRTYA